MIIDDDLDVRPQDEGDFQAPSKAWLNNDTGPTSKKKDINAAWRPARAQESDSSSSDEGGVQGVSAGLQRRHDSDIEEDGG